MTGSSSKLSLSAWGARWLGHEVDEPEDDPHRPLIVGDDFSVQLNPSASLAERFRVERFAQWTQSYPNYVYQINQRSLRRALDENIPPARILQFLRQRSRQVPDKVAAALTRVAS